MEPSPITTRRSPRYRKTAFLIFCVLGSFAYIGLCARHFLGTYFADRPTLQNLRRASALEPENAYYRYLLGRYYQLIAQEPKTALSYYQSAVALNPHVARYWFDLSNTYQELGNQTQQTQALERATFADPTTPDIAWEAANLAWVEGDTNRALREFRVVLQGDLSRTPSALERCWRIKPDVKALLDETVPETVDVYSAFLVFLISKNEASAADAVWARLIGLDRPIEQRYAFEYVHFLLDRREISQAQKAWLDAGRLSDLASYQPSPENLVINSDFNLPLLNAGFDWVYEPTPGVTLALDAAEARSGHSALSVVLDTTGIETLGLRQMIPVEPSSKYEFSAYFKTEDMQGAGGLRFALQDFYSGATCFSSDDLKDEGFWKPATGNFVTGPETKMLLLP